MTSRSRATPALALAALLLPAVASAQPTVTDNRFVIENIYSGEGMVPFDFDATGRMYVGEKRGRILLLTPNGSGGYNRPTVFADIRGSVNPDQESGLLGLALDPAFASNRYLYVLYTTNTDQRLVRMRANTAFTQLEAGSATTLLAGLPRRVNFHKAGDIAFHPNDPSHIYIALGDDGDERNVQNPDFYDGKMLKVRSADGRGVSTNPYWNGNADSVRSRVWAVGFRNPFRIAFHPSPPVPDVMYVSENGNAIDKLSWVRMGSNGAWSPAGDNGGFLNPPDPNHRVLATDSPSLIGIDVVQGGPFADPDFPNSTVVYLSNWITPLQGGSIRRFRLTGANLDTAVPVARDGGRRFVSGLSGAHIKFGPDGALYTASSQNGESIGGYFAIQRIRFNAGTPPIAAFTTSPSPASGDAPLTVQFTDGSRDPDGTIQSRAWTFGDGASSTDVNPRHTYSTPGTYTARLVVTDNSGQTAQATTTVTVVAGNALTLDVTLRDGRGLADAPLPDAVELRLYQVGGAPAPFAGGTGPDGNALTVPAGGRLTRSVNAQLTGGGVVISVGEGSARFRTLRRGFVVPAGQPSATVSLEAWLSDTALRGRIIDTRGASARTDLGVARGGPGGIYAIGGGRDYAAGSGIPASGVRHRTESDLYGYYYVPIGTGGGGATFYFDVVGDTNASRFVPAAFAVALPSGQAVDRDITVGLQTGGAGCDDLAAIPATPNVDYATQIDPIWRGACTGCHNAGSGNSAGLDLQTDGYRAIVGVASREVPGRRLVEPGNVAASFLFEKINCLNPQVGTRMRPADQMPLPQQALIRDWIAQGARPPVQLDAGVPVDSGVGNPDADPVDLGVEPEDAGFPPDATPGMDAEPPADAGLAPDADLAPDVAPAPDATPGVDAAPAPDAAPGVDATPAADATAETDAGVGDEPAPSDGARLLRETGGGCGCDQRPLRGSTAPLWSGFFLIVMALGRGMREGSRGQR